MKKKIGLLCLTILVLGSYPVWDEDIWSQSLEKMTSIVSLIEEAYYQDVDHENLVHSSIKGTLLTLDPHSYFLNPKNLRTLKEDYGGKYSGLGIMIQKHEDRLMVISPIEGTPAYRLGVQPGDIISHIEGESTKPISSFQAMQKLRGKKGTSVMITIVREGLDKPIDLTITRAEIPLHSVPYAFMLQGDVGYVFIRNFSETTTRELEEKMQLLEEQGMKKLILDFRGNGGGTFLQSLEIADLFLPKGTPIVSIKGRKRYYNREFRASRDNQYEEIPLIILVNRGTASAPEIVSGAVKDNDRGLIIGEDSFGKGLVQTVFGLAPDAAVALTTARYYTPSGRSIQRDYSRLEDYGLRREVLTEEREVAYTVNGRVVLGQGGISPDYEVKFSGKELTFRLLFKGTFFTYAREFAEKKTPLSKELMKDNQIDRSFRVGEKVLEDFKVYLKEAKFEFKPKEFEDATQEIKKELDREIFSSFWGIEEGIRVFQMSDAVVNKALDAFSEAEDLAVKH